jgi:nicotinamidase-related amidase
MHDEFFHWLSAWERDLPTQLFEDLDNPKKIALVSVDMVVGFCHKGSLASNEVKNIIPSVVDLFKKSHEYGVDKFLLVQDAHDHEAKEFAAYPPHCIKGSDEAETIPEIKELSFSNLFTTIEKNSLSPMYEEAFDRWLIKHQTIDTFVIVGDCTDLCIYSMAMHLRLHANAKNHHRRIIVPANAIATYDLSIKNAQKIGVFPHPEALLNPLFLYHMALNAIEVVKYIE